MKTPDGTVHPRDVLHDVLANGGAERLLRGEVLTRSAAGNRWTKKRPRSPRDLYRARQERVRRIRKRAGMVPRITVDSEPQNRHFSVAQIRGACKILEIKQPVRISTVTWSREHPREHDRGDYNFLGGEHVIRLDDDPRASAAKLSERLWHELCHARQREEHGATYSAKYAAEQALVGYDANCYEVEASELSSDLAPGMPLCR